MKTLTTSLRAILLLIIFSIISCSKEDFSSFDYGINPSTQQDLLCKSLRLKGNNYDGDIPFGNNFGQSLQIGFPERIEISAGVLLILPFNVSNINEICKIYLQIEGADNYWDAQIETDPASGNPFLEILIPRFVEKGSFEFNFSLEDCNGNLSGIYNTITEINEIANCDTQLSGTVGITIRTFDLGDKKGVASFFYQMYTIKDRLDIRYNGEWVASTGDLFNKNVRIPDCDNKTNGFVSGEGVLDLNYDPNLSKIVELYISGCNSGTQWDIVVACPN